MSLIFITFIASLMSIGEKAYNTSCPPAMRETWVQSLGWEDPLGKGVATHASILAWRSPWNVQSMGSQRVRYD